MSGQGDLFNRQKRKPGAGAGLTAGQVARLYTPAGHFDLFEDELRTARVRAAAMDQGAGLYESLKPGVRRHARGDPDAYTAAIRKIAGGIRF